MSSVIEIRTYRAKPGMRKPLLELLTRCAFPLQRGLGMKVLGPFPSRDDDEPLKAAFYEGDDWLGALEAEAMTMLDDCSATVVEDNVDLWSRWPSESPANAADA